MYSAGQQEVQRNMFDYVQGINPQQGNVPAFQPITYPYVGLPQPGPSNTSFPNEMASPMMEQPYIRMVGAPPGTLDRMRRIVAKQKLCYEQQNADVPEWLEADFLYRLNYGPGTREDVERARKTLLAAKAQPDRRLSVTLLDRVMAKTLHEGIFSKSRAKLFKTDWTQDDVDVQDIRLKSPWMPFDYPDSDEMAPLMWCEEYTIHTLWSRYYSSSILGTDRPPMAGIARDIITLINYLEVSYLEQPLLNYLKDCYSPLFSIPPPLNRSIDREWASRGLLADIFTIATAQGRSEYGRDDLMVPNSGAVSISLSRLESIQYPGPDALRLGKSPVDRGSGGTNQLWGTLEEMKADFINSGPYEIVLSINPSDHLTLSSLGKLRIFWEGPKFWSEGGERPLYPGHKTFMKYKYLTLGKNLHAQSIYDEILRTYALLFTRDEPSKRIAQTLFKQHGAELLIAMRENRDDEKASNVVFKTILGKRIIPSGRCVIIPDWSMFYQGHVPMYTHFDHYCGHWAVLQKQMDGWKPQKIRELLQPGYRDRFSWYTTWVSIIFAFFGVFVIVIAIMQTYWGYQATQAAMESLLLQRLQMNLTSQ